VFSWLTIKSATQHDSANGEFISTKSDIQYEAGFFVLVFGIIPVLLFNTVVNFLVIYKPVVFRDKYLRKSKFVLFTWFFEAIIFGFLLYGVVQGFMDISRYSRMDPTIREYLGYNHIVSMNYYITQASLGFFCLSSLAYLILFRKVYRERVFSGLTNPGT
jgi:hypothetical protein